MTKHANLHFHDILLRDWTWPFITLFKLNNYSSVAMVRERIIPTDGKPLVGEVSVNYCEKRVARGQRGGYLQP
jgi:hypothetical protein